MNNQTFEEFYLKYRKISRGYAYGVLHDWSAADDVSQDVLYKMYTIKDGLNIDNEKMMFSLIKRASMNKALDYIKKSSSKHEFVCQEEVAAFLEEQNSVDAEEVFLRKEKKEFMYMVLRRFRKKQPINYEILIQVKYLEISVETVAEEYGLTKSGVNNRIYKSEALAAGRISQSIRIKENPASPEGSGRVFIWLLWKYSQALAHSSIRSVILLMESTWPFPAIASVYF